MFFFVSYLWCHFSYITCWQSTMAGRETHRTSLSCCDTKWLGSTRMVLTKFITMDDTSFEFWVSKKRVRCLSMFIPKWCITILYFLYNTGQPPHCLCCRWCQGHQSVRFESPRRRRTGRETHGESRENQELGIGNKPKSRFQCARACQINLLYLFGSLVKEKWV